MSGLSKAWNALGHPVIAFKYFGDNLYLDLPATLLVTGQEATVFLHCSS